MTAKIGKPIHVEVHVIRCSCGYQAIADFKGEALDLLVEHFKCRHREILADLDKRARKLAICQNGRGYFDDGKGDAWKNAQQTFRDAWTRHAVEYFIREGGL